MSDPDFSPMPALFDPPLTNRGNAFAWEGRITIATPGNAESIPVEVGYPTSDPDAANKTRQAVWRIQQMAALGRGDLIAFARKDRHQGRPTPLPPTL